MTDDERTHWNERYRERDPTSEPSIFLREFADLLPEGQALDVATGGGRNAIFLAECGYEVTGIDISEEGLEIARARATERGVADRTEFIQGDIEQYDFSPETYDVIVVSYCYSLNALPDLKRALSPSGVLLYEHRLHSPDDDSHRFRFHPNDLLRACLDLRVVRYEEPVEISEDATGVRLIARKPDSPTDSQPLPAAQPNGGQ
jgi:SAM-dependent methyltransferase